ncbi:MAG TPA: hypothetical protein VLK84_06775 [Longimicrobium sp.]|nr:hypothetical protein [Longimicrobium sp.]
MTHRILLPALTALLAAAACTPEPEVPAGVISREKFVAANVAVRTLPDTVSQARRDAALKKVGVTDRQLRTWVTVHARQPETLSKAWEDIAYKVDSISGTQPMLGGPDRPVPGGPVPPPSVAGSPPPPRPRPGMRTGIPGERPGGAPPVEDLGQPPPPLVAQ